jgi:lipase
MRLNVHEYGDPAGSPLICLHGVTSHGERFRRLAEERLEGRRVIAPDLRGHGRSGVEPPWSLDAHVADVLETATALGVECADWLGFSYGGRVAAALAAREPERVESLVLLDPALHLPVETCLEQALEERRDLSFADVDEAIEDRGSTLLHTPREMLEEEMSQHLVRGEDGRLRYRYEPVAAIAIWSDMAADPPPVANVPTLVVRGDQSWVPVDLARYPDAQALEVAGGHAVLWEDFDASAAAIVGFFEA